MYFERKFGRTRNISALCMLGTTIMDPAWSYSGLVRLTTFFSTKVFRVCAVNKVLSSIALLTFDCNKSDKTHQLSYHDFYSSLAFLSKYFASSNAPPTPQSAQIRISSSVSRSLTIEEYLYRNSCLAISVANIRVL